MDITADHLNANKQTIHSSTLLLLLWLYGPERGLLLHIASRKPIIARIDGQLLVL